MGPIALFDKSFLEGLSPNEAVWFDTFYSALITPLFFVETLADLEKEVKRGRTPEDVVGSIARKTPVMNDRTNVPDNELCTANLQGNNVHMGNVPVSHASKYGIVDNKKCINIQRSPEQEALQRWRMHEFLEVERMYAKKWRKDIRDLKGRVKPEEFGQYSKQVEKCKNLQQAKLLAKKILQNPSDPYSYMKLIFAILCTPSALQQQIYLLYQNSDANTLYDFAPYSAFIFEVEMFYYITTSKGFISHERPSNKIDISYFHYLPFCQLFISSDKLHKKVAPQFLKDDQAFVWGPDLKHDLGKLNVHYTSLPQDIKDKGIYSFASCPPEDESFLTTRLWDQYAKNWRKPKEAIDLDKLSRSKKLMELRKMSNFPDANITKPFNINDADAVSLEKSIPIQRADWFLLPKNIKQNRE